jgi:hypothetical protein
MEPPDINSAIGDPVLRRVTIASTAAMVLDATARMKGRCIQENPAIEYSPIRVVDTVIGYVVLILDIIYI